MKTMRLLMAVLTGTLLFFSNGCNQTGSSPLAPATAQKQVVVSQQDDMFVPAQLNIPVGTTVLWDSSLDGHTVHFDNGDNLTCGQNLTTFPNSYTFNHRGTFHLHCDTDSPCESTSCDHCTGMVMVVNVF